MPTYTAPTYTAIDVKSGARPTPSPRRLWRGRHRVQIERPIAVRPVNN